MSMRDVLILSLALPGIFVALWRPWVGVMMWTWISIMNPHRLGWGIAYDAPLAALSAAATLIGLVATKDERASPFKGPPVTILAVFVVWMTISWLMGIDPVNDYEQWSKVMKVNLMLFVGLAVLHSKQHVLALMWVSVGSLALLGMKGGVFTLATGGNHRVWGPPGTFIADNNEFALALITAVPMLRFLQLQLSSKWGRRLMTLAMLLCATAALGSHSRGGLLALLAMSMLLWWRGRSRLVGGVMMIVAGVALVSFMPDSWTDRMATIETYQADHSAIGRISAWWNAWNMAFHYPFGAGFNAARPALFAKYSPYPEFVQGAHSIYFLVLGNHGFIGLALYLALGVATWRSASWLRVHGAKSPESIWCAELGSMAQVSLLGFAVGGAFLSLSYFDLPYIIMSAVVVTRIWVQTEGWRREPTYVHNWKVVPGMGGPARRKPSQLPVQNSSGRLG
ncbi:MAG: putative O-glycosylation ligase, exosortase A system-associated [Leptothrix sp. (in: Bacteria)]|nr:putative O-glycosylation ligase, exosortase A system-associated [Leptothrix sp. (in: b-proteobacteria)]